MSDDSTEQPIKNDDDDEHEPEEPIKQDDGGRKGRRLLLLCAFPATFLFAGAYYGWGPLQLVMEQNGIYHDKCGDDPEVCDAQTAALLNVRLVGQLTIIASPLLGELSDRKGARYVAYFLTAMTFVGLLLIIIADQTDAYWIMYIASSCLALVAWSGGLLTVETGLVFQGKTRSRIISALNACYDAGAITYLGLWGISEGTNATLTDLIAGYLGLAVLCLGCYSYSWAKVCPENDQETHQQEETEDHTDCVLEAQESIEATAETARSQAAESAAHIQSMVETGNLASNTDEQDSTIQHVSDNEASESDDVKVEKIDKENVGKLFDMGQDESQTEAVVGSSTTPESSRKYIIIANRSKKAQLLSEPVVMLCAFFSFHLTSNVWTLVTARDFLKYLGDDDYNNRYLTIFTLMTPVSLLALPFEDIAIHKFGFIAALQTVNVLAVAHGIIKVATENLNVQILGFVFFSFFRCFLFAVTFSFLPNIISMDLTGRAVGIFYLTGGVASFINIPLSNLAVNRLGGNFFIPNMVYLILTIPFFWVVWRIGKGLDRENKAKQASQDQGESIVLRRSSLYQGGQVARFSVMSRNSVVTPLQQSTPSRPISVKSLHGVSGERKGSVYFEKREARRNRRSSV